MEINKPGLYDMDFSTYLADPCPRPSLNASTAGVLLNKSPRHAWMKHSRLNPNYVSTNAPYFDLGKVAHALLLEGEERVVIIDASDWRTKAAKEARDEAYARGETPLLAHQFEEVKAMVDAAKAQLLDHKDLPPLSDGEAEKTIVFQVDGIWCRCRTDWISALQAEEIEVIDYKTTTNSHPDAFTRSIYKFGYDVGEAFYRLGVKTLFGVEPRYRFVAQETEPPYALSVIELTPAAKAMGDAKVSHALDIWRRCLGTDKWPGYPAQTAYVSAPAYEAMRWEEMKERDKQMEEAGESAFDAMLHWQAPIKEAKK